MPDGSYRCGVEHVHQGQFTPYSPHHRPARELQSDHHEREGRISAKSISEPRRKDSEFMERTTAAIIAIGESGLTSMVVPEEARAAAEMMSSQGITVEKVAILALDQRFISQVYLLVESFLYLNGQQEIRSMSSKYTWSIAIIDDSLIPIVQPAIVCLIWHLLLGCNVCCLPRTRYCPHNPSHHKSTSFKVLYRWSIITPLTRAEGSPESLSTCLKKICGSVTSQGVQTVFIHGWY